MKSGSRFVASTDPVPVYSGAAEGQALRREKRVSRQKGRSGLQTAPKAARPFGGSKKSTPLFKTGSAKKPNRILGSAKFEKLGGDAKQAQGV